MNNNEVKTSANTKYSFNTIFKIFLKTGKRRLIITILTGIALFLVLSTFFMTWFSYRYTSFSIYIEKEHNWRKDGNTSVYSGTYLNTPIDLSYSYLDDKISLSLETLDTIIPNAVENYTAGLSAEVFDFIEPLNEIFLIHKFLSLDNTSNEILYNCLIEGRLPTNQSEILFYRQSVNSSYALNDIISVRGVNLISGSQSNFTIVGIVDNVKGQLYTHGFSYDIINQLIYGSNYYEEDVYDNSIFFSNNDFLTSIIRNFTLYSGYFSVAIDFNYQIKANHIRNIPQYIDNFENYYYYNYYYFNYFCGDLYYAFLSFDEHWLLETIRMFICSLPILIVFGLVCVEVFKIGTHELESKFRLMKIQGMEYKTIKQMIVLENFIFSGSSLLLGTTLGFFLSYFIFMGFGNANFSDYFFSLLEPVIFITLVLLFLFFFLGGFLLENSLAKKTAKLTPSRYRSKRSERFRRFIRTPEVAIFLIGLGLLALGFVGFVLINQFGYLIPAFNFFKYMLAFSYVMGIGGLFVIISVFLFLSRLVMLLWQLIGKGIWKQTKSFVSLSLKHLSIYNKNYQRAILIIFILSLAITPGIISSRSAKIHNHYEANLQTGYADLVINDWQPYYKPIKQNITDIEGVSNALEIDIHSYYIYDQWGTGYSSLRVNVIIVDNITDFLDIVNEELYTITSYTKEDIARLENNMTCFINTKHVKELHLKNGSKVVMECLNNMAKPIESIYIQSFNYFPTFPIDTFYTSWYDRADYIVSGLTWKTLENHTRLDSYYYSSSKLLIKTATNANITYIKDVLGDNFGFETFTGYEIEQMLNEKVNYFGLYFFKISTAMALLASMFFGYITARNIYHQRLRIIESQYQIGAKRNQIWLSYTIELLFIIILPLVIGLGATIPLLKAIMPFIFNLNTIYYRFNPWIPWWIILIILGLGYFVMTSGWLLEIIPLVRKYRPIKQE
ncbi:MAG: FtsX-like permease family protein [Candidatus Heimdallarchaeota archaeon]|nr:FtsX-like permease family protein [Candidatus Heimdallarchaeota archaeon]